jgi:hypothetical protein
MCSPSLLHHGDTVGRVPSPHSPNSYRGSSAYPPPTAHCQCPPQNAAEHADESLHADECAVQLRKLPCGGQLLARDVSNPAVLEFVAAALPQVPGLDSLKLTAYGTPVSRAKHTQPPGSDPQSNLAPFDLSHWPHCSTETRPHTMQQRQTEPIRSHLSGFISLQHLGLRPCFIMTEHCLERIRGLTGLRHLNLKDCFRLTDDNLEHLSNLGALQHLNLLECKSLTDHGLEHLSGLIALQFLALPCCLRAVYRGFINPKPTNLQRAHKPEANQPSEGSQTRSRPTYIGFTKAHIKLLAMLDRKGLEAPLRSDSTAAPQPKLSREHDRPVRGAPLRAHSAEAPWPVPLRKVARRRPEAPLRLLQHLDLAHCTDLTRQGLKRLCGPIALQHLHLNFENWCSLTEYDLESLSHLRALQYIGLGGHPVGRPTVWRLDSGPPIV